jgi:hypothetical protein
MARTPHLCLLTRSDRVGIRGAFTCLALVLLLLGPACAHGQKLRQGFVWSFGLGASPVAHWSFGDWNEGGAGISMRGVFGFLVSRRNVLGLEYDMAWAQSDTWGMTLLHGFMGPAWHHYYGRPGKSLISVVGVGLSGLDGGNYYYEYCSNCPPRPPHPTVHRGLGALAGIGYEFDRNWQCVANFSMGSPQADFDRGHYNTYFFNVVLSYMSD